MSRSRQRDDAMIVLTALVFILVMLIAARHQPSESGWVVSKVDPRVHVTPKLADSLDNAYWHSVSERHEYGGCLVLGRKNGDDWYFSKMAKPRDMKPVGAIAMILDCEWATVPFHTHWNDTVFVVDTSGAIVGYDTLHPHNANQCLPSWNTATSDIPQVKKNERVLGGLVVCGYHKWMLFGEKL